jgi:hypothetical protein
MPDKNKWYRDQRLWLEAFVLVNLAFLSLDIYLAHSVNQFQRAAEYLPLYFSMAAPFVLLVGLVAGEWLAAPAVGRDLGYLVGWLAVVLGLVGVSEPSRAWCTPPRLPPRSLIRDWDCCSS